MVNGSVTAILIALEQGGPMHNVIKALANAGVGLDYDRYARGQGTYSNGEIGHRQVTFIDANSFDTIEQCKASRRNVFIRGVHPTHLIGREYQIGQAIFRGLMYCERGSSSDAPVESASSPERLHEGIGGIIAEIIQTGLIWRNDPVILLPRMH